MDPSANLNEQISTAHAILAAEDRDEPISTVDAVRLADLVLALDEWRRGGGFDPYDNVRRSIANV